MNKPIPEPHFDVVMDFKNEWYWILKSARGDEIAKSGTTHKMRAKCIKSIPTAKEMMQAATSINPSD